MNLNYFLIGMAIFCALPIFAMIFDFLFMKKNPFFCKLVGWHRNVKETTFDGCSLHGECSRCGKSVMKDGQGNWF